jgi:hypothetical protein
MYKNTKHGVAAFHQNIAFTGPSSRVLVGEQDGDPIITIFSYDLKVGEKRGGPFGKIHLLPMPIKGTPIEQGGSKTSRSLIRALWAQYPTAQKLV